MEAKTCSLSLSFRGHPLGVRVQLARVHPAAGLLPTHPGLVMESWIIPAADSASLRWYVGPLHP